MSTATYSHLRENLAAVWDEVEDTQEHTNRKTALRIMDLVEAVLRDPFEGVGKPEPLERGRRNDRGDPRDGAHEMKS